MFHLPDDEEAYYDALSGFDIDDVLARLFCWFCWIISPAKSGLSRYSVDHAGQSHDEQGIQFRTEEKLAGLAVTYIQNILDHPGQTADLALDNLAHLATGAFFMRSLVGAFHCKLDRRKRLAHLMRQDRHLVPTGGCELKLSIAGIVHRQRVPQFLDHDIFSRRRAFRLWCHF